MPTNGRVFGFQMKGEGKGENSRNGHVSHVVEGKVGEHEKHTHKGTFFVFEGRGKGDKYKKHAQTGVFLVLWKGKWANTKNTPIRAHFSCSKKGECGEGREMVLWEGEWVNMKNTLIEHVFHV